MAKTCVKCGYERQPTDTAPDYECPKCGVIYAKAEAALAASLQAGIKQVKSDVETVKNSKSKISTKVVVFSIFVIVAIGLIGNNFFTKYKEQVKKQEEAARAAQIALEVEKNKKLMQTAAKDFLVEAIKGSMKDPDSLQLRSVQEFTETMKHEGGIENVISYTLCGEMNAKNSYGGYVGFKPFFAIVTAVGGTLSSENVFFKVRPDDGDSSSFSTSEAEYCKNVVTFSGV